jgi:IMP dehydrogenase
MATFDKFVPFEGLSFDDVLLLPGYSKIRPADVDLSVQLTPHLKLKIPIISIHMDTVTEDKMAIAMAREGGLGIIHRNQSIEEEADQVAQVKKNKGETEGTAVDNQGRLLVAAAIGVGEDWEKRSLALVRAGVDALAIDVSSAHKKNTLEVTKKLRNLYKNVDIISGNIATYEGSLALIKAGAHAIKVGVGNGTICTLRVVSGVGIPQISALFESVRAAKNTNVSIVADGGTKNSGDITKALATGAMAVAVGSQLAGCKETPGKIVVVNGKKFKQYRGMGSSSALKEKTGDRYDFKTKSVNTISQGVEALVPYKGSVKDKLFQMVGGVKSGMGYIGAKTIEELHQKAKFIKITNAGLIESHPFNVLITKDEPNYAVR